MKVHAGTEVSQALAAEVRAEIAVQQRTANGLAIALGIGAHTVGRRLSGASPFSVLELAVAAGWLGTTPDALLRRAERRVARTRRARGQDRKRRALADEAAAS